MYRRCQLLTHHLAPATDEWMMMKHWWNYTNRGYRSPRGRRSTGDSFSLLFLYGLNWDGARFCAVRVLGQILMLQTLRLSLNYSFRKIKYLVFLCTFLQKIRAFSVNNMEMQTYLVNMGATVKSSLNACIICWKFGAASDNRLHFEPMNCTCQRSNSFLKFRNFFFFERKYFRIINWSR